MSRIRLRAWLCLLVYLSFTKFAVCDDFDIENYDDDQIISQLWSSASGTEEPESDVSKILEVLEGTEQNTSEDAAVTPAPIPFEGLSNISFTDLQELDVQLNTIITELAELEGMDESTFKQNLTADSRSDEHIPELGTLLWSTASAIWDVSKPTLLNTKTGRKATFLKETLTLPLRTYGHIKHKIWDLTTIKKRSIAHHLLHDYHHHDHGHGWGWDPKNVYVKYEPHNSLFKSWLIYLYRAIRPVIICKIRLKRQLLRIKLRLLRHLIGLFKHAKIQKIFTILRIVIAKLQHLKSQWTNVVVIKDEHKGWGWNADHHHHPQPASYSWAAAPPPKATEGWEAPPTESYGWPPASTPDTSYGPPASKPDTSYGPPAASSQISQAYQRYQPSTTRASPEAYGNANVYGNHYSAPTRDLLAPSASENETPTYANYLKELGINPSSLSEIVGKVRNFRETNVKTDPEDLPYLTEEAESEGSKTRNL